MVSLKLKLSSSPLYLLSSVYIFIRFINSLLNPWFWFCSNGPIIISRLIRGWFCYTNEIGYAGNIISKAGFIGNKVKIRVIIVLILIRLLLKRWLICLKLNSLLVAIYSLILNSVHSISSSSCSIFKSDYRTITRLSFLTHTL